MQVSAPTREKALSNDPWTAAQKEGMTPGQLAGHQQSLAQNRDMTIATDLHDSLLLSSVKSGDKSIQALLDRANGLENKLQAATRGLRNEETKPEAER
jgi:hypothetical protein